jgi:hypothetical protein
MISIAAAAAIASSAVPATPAAAYTINVAGGRVGGYVSSIGDFRPSGDASIAAAQRVFGSPSSRKLTTDNSCDVRWRRLRLRITFANFGLPGPGQTACSDSASNAQTFRTRGPRFRTWRGLRVGRREESISDRHPTAELRRGTWWLKTSISLYGDDQEFPVVEAIVARTGRIRALRGWIGVAGD